MIKILLLTEKLLLFLKLNYLHLFYHYLYFDFFSQVYHHDQLPYFFPNFKIIKAKNSFYFGQK